MSYNLSAGRYRSMNMKYFKDEDIESHVELGIENDVAQKNGDNDTRWMIFIVMLIKMS